MPSTPKLRRSSRTRITKSADNDFVDSKKKRSVTSNATPNKPTSNKSDNNSNSKKRVRSTSKSRRSDNKMSRSSSRSKPKKVTKSEKSSDSNSTNTESKTTKSHSTATYSKSKTVSNGINSQCSVLPICNCLKGLCGGLKCVWSFFFPSNKKYLFGGPFLSHIMIYGIFFFILGIYSLASSGQHTIWRFPPVFSHFSSLKSFKEFILNHAFKKEVSLRFGAFFLNNFLVAIMGGFFLTPLRSKLNRRASYTLSGIFQLIFVVIVVSYIFHSQRSAITYMSNNWLPLLMINCTVVKVLVLFFFCWSYRSSKSTVLSTYGNSGCITYNLLAGRELHARLPSWLGSVDLKMLCNSIGLTFVFALDFMMFSRNMSNINMVALFTLHCVFVIERLYHECFFVDSFIFANQGFGMIQSFLNMVFYPFLWVFPMFCLSQGFIKLEEPFSNMYFVGGVTFFGLVTFAITSKCQSLKFTLRRDPNDLSLSHMETIMASNGSRILCSGLFNVVRHPEYLFCFMYVFCCFVLTGFGFGLPWLAFAVVVLVICHRVQQEDGERLKSHGSAWLRYSENVPHKMIPYLF